MSSDETKFLGLRLRAEKLLEQSKDSGSTLLHKDVENLIHDLSVHQIELEMQNEELQQVQYEMQKVRDEYQQLYNHAPTGYISLDDQGVILKHNQTFTTMLGDPNITAIGLPLGSLMYLEDRDIFLARFKAFFKTPEDKNMTARLRCSDGSLSWVRLSGRRDTTMTLSGKPREILLLTLSDINKEKLAEKDMADNLQFVSTLLDTIPSPIYYKDKGGKYLGCNRAYSDLTGFSADFLRGKTIFELAPPELAKRYNDLDLELLEHPGLQNFVNRVDISENEARYYEFFKSTYQDADGNIAGLVCIKIDITEQTRFEEELRISRDAAEKANRIKSEFLATMSHEIRTPMNGILGMVQLLEFTALTDEQKEYLKLLSLSGYNLLTLINDILDLSKVEAGRVELDMTEFCLQAMINDIFRSQEKNIDSKGLFYKVLVADNVPELLMGDTLRVKQILLNLLGNSLKFTERGSIKVSVSVLEECEENVLLNIAVEDTGIGMPPHILENIFQPFTQGDSSTTRRYGGTGLGLTISLRLAELMGGSIRVESSEGYGSTFQLMIPFKVATLKPQDSSKKLLFSDLWPYPSLRILLVEDNDINIRYAVALLEKMGHEVIVAIDGKVALEIMESFSFDLVLMDIQMPVMNGDEAIVIIREKEKESGAHTPIIALTAFALKGDKEKYLKLGFDGYHSKPIEPLVLIEEMKWVLKNKINCSAECN